MSAGSALVDEPLSREEFLHVAQDSDLHEPNAGRLVQTVLAREQAIDDLLTALEKIRDYIDADRKAFADRIVMLGPRAALPIYNIARDAIAAAPRYPAISEQVAREEK